MHRQEGKFQQNVWYDIDVPTAIENISYKSYPTARTVVTVISIARPSHSV